MEQDKDIDPENRYKKVCFTCVEKTHADLRIRLIHDSLSQGALFRILMHGYVQKDENLMTFVDNFREKHKIQRKTYIKKSKNLLAKGRQAADKFALDPDELENIFDLIAQEHPDL